MTHTSDDAGLFLTGLARKMLLIAFIVMGLDSAFAQNQTISLNDPDIPNLEFKVDPAILATHHARRIRPFHLNPLLQSIETVALQDLIILDLFDARQYKARVEKVYQNVNGTLVIRARLVDSKHGFCIISIMNGKSSVVINIPAHQEEFQTIFDPNMEGQFLVEVDPAKKPIFEEAPIVDTKGFHHHAKEEDLANQLVSSSEEVEITLLVCYTANALQWSNDFDGGIDNTISLMMERSQMIMDESKAGVRLKLVHSTEVDYEETGSMQEDLRRIVRPNDGYADNMHDLRYQYEADLVMLLQEGGDFGGIARLFTGAPDDGFSITRIDLAANSHVAAHEIGHNMGCGHHLRQNFQPGPGSETYAAGWRWTSGFGDWYNSVMSYSSGEFFSNGRSSFTVPYFSDPDILYEDEQTGQEYANNARMIRASRSFIADFGSFGPNIDLTITSQQISTNEMVAGDEIELVTFIQNTGIVNSVETNLAVFLSSDPILSQSDRLLAENAIISLGEDESVALETTVKISDRTVAGEYYLLMVVDADNQERERNEDNNIASLKIVVTEGAEPVRDLTITTASVSSARVEAGKNLDLEAELANLDVTLYYVAYALSSDLSYGETDILLAADVNSRIGADGIVTLEKTVLIPPSLAPGTYSLLFVADYNSRVEEINEDNNVRAVEIEVLENTSPPADLALSGVSISTTPLMAGEMVDLEYVLTNRGETVSGEVRVAYVLSTDLQYGADDLVMDNRVLASLSPADETTIQEAVSIPSTTAPGTWYLLIVADYLDQIAESDEGNNIASIELTINQAIASVTTSSNPPEGGTISGGGDYAFGDQVTVTAQPAQGYVFLNWTEEGEEVSVDLSYEFEARGRELVANFSRVVAVGADQVAAVKVYPNPFVDQLNVEWQGFQQLQLYTMTGKEVFTSTESTVRIGTLTKGLYLLILTGKDGEKVNLKVMKQ